MFNGDHNTVTTLQGLRYPEDVHASSYNARMGKQ